MGDYSQILMIVAMVAIFYFLLIRPENQRKKKAEEMRNSIKKGQRITTIGGLMGKVVQVNDNSLVFETSEDRVRIEIAKWGVQSTDAMEAEAAQKTGGLFGMKKDNNADADAKAEEAGSDDAAEPAAKDEKASFDPEIK